MSEFPFELRVCQWAERAWPPANATADAAIVARQLGTRNRRWDTIVVESTDAGLRSRARFGRQRLTELQLYVLTNAPESWQYYRDALEDPPTSWRYIRETINEAADRAVLDRRKRGGRIEIKRKWPYPDWIDSLVAIENKPDLTASAADQLTDQLEFDVALGLADTVWVATESTNERVEPVLLESLPVAVGILTFDWNETPPATVSWRPRRLRASTGTRILERAVAGEHTQQAARFEYVSNDWLRLKRLAIAERVYERGWRSYIESVRPDCRWFTLSTNGRQTMPDCRALSRDPTPQHCGQHCQAFEPEPPGWRTQGWPIDGGPGAALQRLLDRRRSQQRPGLE